MRRDTMEMRAKACPRCLEDKKDIRRKRIRKPIVTKETECRICYGGGSQSKGHSISEFHQLQTMIEHEKTVHCGLCRSEAQFRRRVKRLGCLPCGLRKKREIEIEEEHKRIKRLGCIICLGKRRKKRTPKLQKQCNQNCLHTMATYRRQVRSPKDDDVNDFDTENYDLNDFKELPTGEEDGGKNNVNFGSREDADEFPEVDMKLSTMAKNSKQSHPLNSYKYGSESFGYSFESPYVCDKTCCDFSRCPPISSVSGPFSERKKSTKV